MNGYKVKIIWTLVCFALGAAATMVIVHYQQIAWSHDYFRSILCGNTTVTINRPIRQSSCQEGSISILPEDQSNNISLDLSYTADGVIHWTVPVYVDKDNEITRLTCYGDWNSYPGKLSASDFMPSTQKNFLMSCPRGNKDDLIITVSLNVPTP